MRWIALLLAFTRALLADRARLAAENMVLRQQLGVLRRSVKRPRIEASDRAFWLLMHLAHQRHRHVDRMRLGRLSAACIGVDNVFGTGGRKA